MVEKIKNNAFETTGRLVRDPKKYDDLVIATIAIYNGTDETGKERPAIFEDISFFGKKGQEVMLFKKGQKLNIKGSIRKIKSPLKIKGEEIKHNGEQVMIDKTVLTGYFVRQVFLQQQKAKTSNKQTEATNDQEMSQ